MQKKSVKIGGILGGLAAIATVAGFLWGDGLIQQEYVEVTNASVCGTKTVQVRERSGPWPECRHEKHGFQKYRHSETFEGKSGWVGGGKSQPWWCSALEKRYASRFTEPYSVSTVSSSEDEKKDWKGYVEREYYCKIRFDHDPVWLMQRSPACGEREFVTVEMEQPATCEITRSQAEELGLSFTIPTSQ